jgi:anti-sigma regulatory factor (Ser/Thr protein kinase)
LVVKGFGLAGRLDMSLANDVQEVGRVIDSLEEFSAARGIAPEQYLKFGLALDELITNIISHGLSGRSDGTIRLIVEHADGVLKAELIDNGLPFDPLKVDAEIPTGDIENRKIGGVGLTLVKASMDRLGYRHDGVFNHVNMEMKLKAA